VQYKKKKKNLVLCPTCPPKFYCAIRSHLGTECVCSNV